MKRVGPALIASTVIVMTVVAHWQAEPGRAASVVSKPVVAQDVQIFMQQKLKSSGETMAGIATGDFEKIKSGASKMVAMSKRTMWKQSQTPVYTQYTVDFVSNAQELVKAADAQNLEAASYAFSHLMVRCADCHSHVRSDKVASLDGLQQDLAATP